MKDPQCSCSDDLFQMEAILESVESSACGAWLTEADHSGEPLKATPPGFRFRPTLCFLIQHVWPAATVLSHSLPPWETDTYKTVSQNEPSLP